MEEDYEKRRCREDAIRHQIESAAAERAARERVMQEARRKANLERESKMRALTEAKSRLCSAEKEVAVMNSQFKDI